VRRGLVMYRFLSFVGMAVLSGGARILLFFCVTLLFGHVTPPAKADLDDRPGFDFHPQTNAAPPSRLGPPARGHFAGEVAPAARPQGITLTVKQDPHRLCYVLGNIAEPPVIRVRQGQDLVITLKNEITDPTAIADYVAVNHLDQPNPLVPAEAGF